MAASKYRAVTCFALFVAAGVPADCSSPHMPSQASRSDAEALLHKMQGALGGAKRIAAVRDFEETIRAEAWDAGGGSLGDMRKRTRWMRTPNVVRLDQVGQQGTYVTSEDIRINVGLRAQDLAAKPPDFAPDIPQR